MEYWKLIELLNEFWEYDLVEHNWEICKWTTDDEWEINIYTDYTNNIISKKFWFIKWLIQNKKIDVAKFWAVWEYDSRDYWEDEKWEATNYYYDNFNKHSDLESLLMLLSISDTPIEDLISYLKNVEKSD